MGFFFDESGSGGKGWWWWCDFLYGFKEYDF